MDSRNYYKQEAILSRILEYSEGALYVSGSNPEIVSGKQHRRYENIIYAIGDGCDLFRSGLDFRGPVLNIDLEYANNVNFGEIFHHPLQVFEKFEPLRRSIRDLFNLNRIDNMEIMTGRGYNFVNRVDRKSPSYLALKNIGEELDVLPDSAIRKLIEKEQKFGNIPLVDDSYVYTAYGRISDYIISEMKNIPDLDIPVKTSDIFDESEIAIFDTTMFGYLPNRRSLRCAFSLHQKSRMNPIYNYPGPPIVTIPIHGIPLKERLKIRQYDEMNYSRVIELASEMNTTIPPVDLSSLITKYFLSSTYQKHKNFSNQISSSNQKGKWKIISWIELNKKIEQKKLSENNKNILNMPNPKLLNPTYIRNVVRELNDKNFSYLEIVSIIGHKYAYREFNWESDLSKNDPFLRAEYWVRTLLEI